MLIHQIGTSWVNFAVPTIVRHSNCLYIFLEFNFLLELHHRHIIINRVPVVGVVECDGLDVILGRIVSPHCLPTILALVRITKDHFRHRQIRHAFALWTMRSRRLGVLASRTHKPSQGACVAEHASACATLPSKETMGGRENMLTSYNGSPTKMESFGNAAVGPHSLLNSFRRRVRACVD